MGTVDLNHLTVFASVALSATADFALRLGMGVGPLPAFLAKQDVLAGRLVRVLPRWTALTGGVFLVLPSLAHLPKKTAALRDHVVEALRARAATER
jgi:DNA-binding transcriptional LysR family regulator